MAWAIAICIDLTCVMAARERQRDKRTGRTATALSWPTVVLIGGILLSLAANLAQAEPSVWGWVTAATPAGAFLVAVSMLERRAAPSPPRPSSSVAGPPPSWGRPVQDETPVASVPGPNVPALDQGSGLFPAPEPAPASPSPAPELLDYARGVADDHERQHGRPITRDALRARLGISNQLASELLRQLRTP